MCLSLSLPFSLNQLKKREKCSENSQMLPKKKASTAWKRQQLSASQNAHRSRARAAKWPYQNTDMARNPNFKLQLVAGPPNSLFLPREHRFKNLEASYQVIINSKREFSLFTLKTFYSNKFPFFFFFFFFFFFTEFLSTKILPFGTKSKHKD